MKTEVSLPRSQLAPAMRQFNQINTITFYFFNKYCNALRPRIPSEIFLRLFKTDFDT